MEELALRVAVVEERMNTHQATYETALERLERRMAERDADMADRLGLARWWQTAILSGVIIGGMGICTAIILAAMGAL